MAQIYSYIDTLKSNTGKKYYKNIIYPEIQPTDSDIYVITTVGDRLDLLANDYYKDVSLWKFIASANALPGDSLFIEPGTQLRIPANITGVINNFNTVNKDK